MSARGGGGERKHGGWPVTPSQAGTCSETYFVESAAELNRRFSGGCEREPPPRCVFFVLHPAEVVCVCVCAQTFLKRKPPPQAGPAGSPAPPM